MTDGARRQRVMAHHRRELEGRRRTARIVATVGALAVLVGLFVVLGIVNGGALRSDRSPSPAASAGVAAASLPSGAPATGYAPATESSGEPSAGASPASPRGPSDGPGAAPTPSGPAAASALGATARPSAPPPGATPSPTDAPPLKPSAAPTPSGPPRKGLAPTGPTGFKHQRTTVLIAFPLSKGASYHYRDNYLERRYGKPEVYNHWFSRTNGVIRRAHDGVDIYGRRGTAVLAPFSGTVIDPGTRWKPWRADLYGKSVVIVSDESTSPGYATFLAHLDSVRVAVGQHVKRGQKVGTLGNTGNAKSEGPQLHFELRTPFLFPTTELGRRRTIDSFDPYPSLKAADPHSRSVTGPLGRPVAARHLYPRTDLLWQPV